MPLVRLTSATVSFEHGGKLARNSVVEVDAATANRWKKNGFAIDDDGNDLPPLEGDAVNLSELLSQLARLQREVAAAQARAGGPQRDLHAERAMQRFPQPTTPQASEAPDAPEGPFDLTDGREALGEVRPPAGAPAPADDDDDEDADGAPSRPIATRTRRGARG